MLWFYLRFKLFGTSLIFPHSVPPLTVSLADKQRKLVAGTQYTFSCLAKVFVYFAKKFVHFAKIFVHFAKVFGHFAKVFVLFAKVFVHFANYLFTLPGYLFTLPRYFSCTPCNGSSSIIHLFTICNGARICHDNWRSYINRLISSSKLLLHLLVSF